MDFGDEFEEYNFFKFDYENESDGGDSFEKWDNSDWDKDFDQSSTISIDYHKEYSNKIDSHKEYTVENALKINLLLQEALKKFIIKIENLKHKCNRKYVENEHTINLIKNGDGEYEKENNKDRRSYYGTYKSCGSPYFKDKSLFSPPNNSDYIERKTIYKELFLLDLKPVKHCWTLMDKINVLQGVRQQLTSHLRIESQKKYNQNSIKECMNYIAKKDLPILLKEVENFQINWYTISTINLNGKHPENTCNTMWNMYLRPDLNRDEWTEMENANLNKLAKKNNFENWDMIAKNLNNNRSEYQCFVQFQTEIAKVYNTYHKWTKSDDKLLVNLAEKYSIGKVIRWNLVSNHFPYKTKRQVYLRYRQTVDPTLIKTKFTEEEDCIIMAAIDQHGYNFKNIPLSLFPGRSRLQIRNRYNNVLKFSKLQKFWTIDDDKKLLNSIEIHGESNWSKISGELEHHSRISCRTRYLVIKKYFQKHPNAELKDLPRKKRPKLTDVNADNWCQKLIESRDKQKNNFDNNNDEDNNENKKKKSNKKTKVYTDKLKYFYDHFKLSYNFKYKDDGYYCDTKNWRDLLILTTLFEFNVNSDEIKKKKDKFLEKEFKTIKHFLNNQINGNNFCICVINSKSKIPPNWTTLLGLRALYIHHTSYKKNKNKNLKVIKKTEPDDNVEDENVLVDLAKKKFRERFFCIFYKTIILNNIKVTQTKEDKN